MNIWFASDHHLNHKNIIKYESRPFKDVDEMFQVILERHNSVVKTGDKVFFLGDFKLCSKKSELEVIQKFNGGISIILGNHDRFKPSDYINAGFTWASRFPVLFDQRMILSHSPQPEEALGKWFKNIHGHLHHKDPPRPLDYFNCSMERISYLPIHYETIRKLVFAKG